MKLNEIFNYNTVSTVLQDLTPEKIADAIEYAKRLPEFKEVEEAGYELASSPMQLKKGILSFKFTHIVPKFQSDDFYSDRARTTIYPNGKCLAVMG
ncbi:MAG: hypothetical protein QXN55_01110 [Candidatus Nitrosotenuis sp.]